ncbi:MAG TPA: hypothetical protein VND94_18920 [Terriglobia bacterium]|nr:hypothetical protein [Terriglobia bacterium]
MTTTRTTPSQVLAYIKDTWPAPASLQPFTHGHRIVLGALLELADSVPSELLTVPPADQAQFFVARTAIREVITSWQSGFHSVTVAPLPGLKARHPVFVIFDVLSRCCDEVPSAQVSGLTFISDQDFRDLLRLDISSAMRALSNGEWKAATVISGSIIEALLLWKLKSDEPKANTAAQVLVANGSLSRKPDSQLDRWTLHELIETAAHLNMIGANTAASARLAKDFRNLIHPGKAIRTGMKATLGGAQVALGALDFVIQDFS